MKVISSNTFFAEQWLNFFIRSQPMPRHTLYHTIYPEQQGIPWLSFKSNLTRRHIHKRSTIRWQDQVSSRDQSTHLGTRPSEAPRRKMFKCVLSPHPINARTHAWQKSPISTWTESMNSMLLIKCCIWQPSLVHWRTPHEIHGTERAIFHGLSTQLFVYIIETISTG